jgi:hypothetical protein
MNGWNLTRPIGDAGAAAMPWGAAAAAEPLRAVKAQVLARTTRAAGAPRR